MPGAPLGPTRWLDQDEMRAWLGLLGIVMELPQALDRQLRAQAGIGHAYYSILAVLSSSPNQESRLRDIAARTGTSLSRLSHAIDALQDKGWVLRQPSEDARRSTARLTPAGAAMLERVAPGHVSEVRRLVFDRLDPQDVRHLTEISAKLRSAGDQADRSPLRALR